VILIYTYFYIQNRYCNWFIHGEIFWTSPKILSTISWFRSFDSRNAFTFTSCQITPS
jgi:hypothetical protein